MNNIIYYNSDHLERPETDLNFRDVRCKLYNENQDITIIIQAFGRVNKTRNCVESVIHYTKMNYTLILIDNGTTDDSLMEYYKSISYPNKKIIKFSKNITGVYALNKVFKMSDSKYIIMLPNDIIVTHNWLDNMLICAESDADIGMICPVSTNISNYQYENLGGFENVDEMQKKALDFNVSNPLKWEEKIRLIPTATLYRREMFDNVGFYDIGFMHDFGDDDFTFRVRRAGYKLILCRDTFVHHDHDQTALPQERIDIMNHSREFFKEKYKGIDAWNDTTNSILLTFDNIKFNNCKEKKILALDVKCGTPILETKNFLRKNNISTSKISAYTSNSLYLTDLQSISDKCICGDIEYTICNEDEKYDIIILGNPINNYNKPIELLKTLISKKNEEAFIIFPVKNVNDLKSMLSILNIKTENDEYYPRKIDYNQILNKVEDFGITNADVTYTIHNIDANLKTGLTNLVLSMDVKGDKKQIMQSLLINDYWIIIS